MSSTLEMEGNMTSRSVSMPQLSHVEAHGSKFQEEKGCRKRGEDVRDFFANKHEHFVTRLHVGYELNHLEKRKL